MNVWRGWKERKARRQAAGWHMRVIGGLTEVQRRAFELWVSQPLNAAEFRACRAIHDLAAGLEGRQRKAVFDSISPAAPAKLAKPPATQLVSALRWLLTEAAYTRIVAPLVAQEQHEYYEAIRCGDTVRTRWIAVRMHVLIAYCVMLALLAPISRLFRSAS